MRALVPQVQQAQHVFKAFGVDVEIREETIGYICVCFCVVEVHRHLQVDVHLQVKLKNTFGKACDRSL